MIDKVKVLHLVDDSTAGGVMRVVDFIESFNDQQAKVHHKRLQVQRGRISARRYQADLIVSHLAISWRSLPAIIALRIANFGKPLIHVEHSYTEGFVAHNVKHMRRFTRLLRSGFALFDQVVSVSLAQAKWFHSLRLCSDRKIKTIQSCADMTPFRRLPDRNGPNLIFAAIGRFDRQKGFDKLISAFKSCSEQDIKLHIYGEGEQEDALRILAQGDDRIEFKGFAQNPVDAFAQCDVVVMPSRWEAYGLVAIEALSAGKSLICSDVDGLRDHQALGAIVLEKSSTRAITAAISKLRQENHARGRYSRAATRSLEEVFFRKWTALVLGLTQQETRVADHRVRT